MRLPWSQPGANRAGGVAGARKLKGHDPYRRSRTGQAELQEEEQRRLVWQHVSKVTIRQNTKQKINVYPSDETHHLSRCEWQVLRSGPSLRRSESPTRLLLSDWLRAGWAPPQMMMKVMMMRTTGMESGGRSWSRLSPPTIRLVSAVLP